MRRLCSLLALLVTTAPCLAQSIGVESGTTLTVASGSFVNISSGSLSMSPGSRLELQGELSTLEDAEVADFVTEISGQQAGIDHGRLSIGGELSLVGDATVSFAGGYMPGPDDVSTLATYDAVANTFGAESLPPDWSLEYEPTALLFSKVAPLPLAWLHFGAAAGLAGVALDWRTAEERNTDYFAVERSRDHDTWTKLGEVSAHGDGAGPFAYDFLDADPGGAGTVYYRIEQFDRDGTSAYSTVASVNLSSEANALRAFPNPAPGGGLLQVRGVNADAGPTTFRLADASGRVVLSGEAEALAGRSLVLPVLPKGYYLLEVRYRGGVPGRVGVIVE